MSDSSDQLTDYQIEAEYFERQAAFRDVPAEFFDVFAQVKTETMTSRERVYSLYNATCYVVNAGIPGAFVECGVWRGGSAMTYALAARQTGDTSREVYLYDTYQGLPKPEEVDVDLWDNPALESWAQHATGSETGSGWGEAAVEVVRANMQATGYPEDRIHYVKGMVEDTIPATLPDAISVLRLDTDWYSSTKHAMEHLYPRLSRGGVLIIDDYGHWRGARQAVDEYMAAHGVSMLLNRVDYTGRMGVRVF